MQLSAKDLDQTLSWIEMQMFREEVARLFHLPIADLMPEDIYTRSENGTQPKKSRLTCENIMDGRDLGTDTPPIESPQHKHEFPRHREPYDVKMVPGVAPQVLDFRKDLIYVSRPYLNEVRINLNGQVDLFYDVDGEITQKSLPFVSLTHSEQISKKIAEIIGQPNFNVAIRKRSMTEMVEYLMSQSERFKGQIYGIITESLGCDFMDEAEYIETSNDAQRLGLKDEDEILIYAWAKMKLKHVPPQEDES